MTSPLFIKTFKNPRRLEPSFQEKKSPAWFEVYIYLFMLICCKSAYYIQISLYVTVGKTTIRGINGYPHR